MSLPTYDLDDLIFDPPAVTVEIKGKSRTFYIRPPDEMERSMAQASSRAQSRDLRKRLESPRSEERRLLITEQLESVNDDELRLIWTTQRLMQEIFKIERRSLENRDEYFVPAPEESEPGVPPTAEDVERWEDDKDKAEKHREEDVVAAQKAATKALEDQAKTFSHKSLIEQISPQIVEQLAGREWNAEFGFQLIVRCTFLDKNLTKPAFKTIGIVKRLMVTPEGTKLIEELRNAHMGLMLQPDSLGNLEGEAKS